MYDTNVYLKSNIYYEIKLLKKMLFQNYLTFYKMKILSCFVANNYKSCLCNYEFLPRVLVASVSLLSLGYQRSNRAINKHIFVDLFRCNNWSVNVPRRHVLSCLGRRHIVTSAAAFLSVPSGVKGR